MHILALVRDPKHLLEIKNEQNLHEIRAKANDTLHLSYLGYKSIKVKVSNDLDFKGSALFI